MKKLVRWILPVLCIAWMIFIWHFSFSPATESAETSGDVRQVLNGVLENWGVSFRFSDHTVRKTAHFTEFFVLGLLAAGAGLSANLEFPFLTAALAPIFAAAVDETIQRFVPGRACLFTDALLDCAGGFCGVLLVFLFYLLFTRRRRKQAVCGKDFQNIS